MERPLDERHAFLASAAADDEELRREVQSLLAADASEAAFLDCIPRAISAAAGLSGRAEAILAEGTRVGPYEIVTPLAAGAMGEVYRARDTKLHREVALKILPPRFAGDPDRLARFAREAQVLAALNHPNIAAIYGFEDSSPVHALVLEMVDGPTLADRIKGGPLPTSEAIITGGQIAGALEAAHRQGIVHRDLKPANIKVGRNGAVKVLDFGLAKVWERAAGAGPRASFTVPTLTAVQTHTLLGTPAYMSPEQARGDIVDARTDVWSFGCVLFEMLTGRRAFGGDTLHDAIANVLQREVEWDAFPASTPAPLRALVRRCLEKDVNRRRPDIGEARLALDNLLAGEPAPSRARGGAPGDVGTRRPRRATLMLGLVAVVGLGGAAALLWHSRSPEAKAPLTVTHTQITFEGDVRNAALSPDGRHFAYVADDGDTQRLMVRDLSAAAALEIARGVGPHFRWSPDGTRLAYNDGARIAVVSRFGGATRVVAPGALCSWSPDGTRLAVASRSEQGFRIVPVDGGTLRHIALPGLSRLEDLDWNPRLDRLALAAFDDRRFEWSIWTVRLDGTALHRVHLDTLKVFSPRWAPKSEAIYALRQRDSAELLSIPADGTTPPRVLLSGVQSGGPLTLSSDGLRLLHTRVLEYSNLWRAPIDGRAPPVPRAITTGTSKYWNPRVSPDGRWVVTATDAVARDSIAKLPFTGGQLMTLASPEGGGTSPAWSADGSRIYFATNRRGVPEVWFMDAAGREVSKLETSEVGTNLLVSAAPNGRVAWQQSTTGRSLNYCIRDPATGQEELLVKPSPGSIFSPTFSRRNDRVAVAWMRPDRSGLWVLTWPGRDQRFLTKMLTPVGWSPDDSWIYAFRGRRVFRVSSETGHATLITSFPGTILSADVTPDGRDIVSSVAEHRGDAWLIENFDPQAGGKSH